MAKSISFLILICSSLGLADSVENIKIRVMDAAKLEAMGILPNVVQEGNILPWSSADKSKSFCRFSGPKISATELSGVLQIKGPMAVILVPLEGNSTPAPIIFCQSSSGNIEKSDVIKNLSGILKF